MTCRRSDRANLMSCRVAGPFLRGCCDFWAMHCSYPTRFKIDPHNPTSSEILFPASYTLNDPRAPAAGRTNLHFRQCQNHHRPKFICPRRGCRRSIKPFYDPDRLVHRISEFGHWSATPRADVNERYAAAVRNGRAMRCGRQRGRKGQALSERMDELMRKGDPDEEHGYVTMWPEACWARLSDEEREEVRGLEPDVWETLVVRGMTGDVGGGAHAKRCPGCGGDAVRVGSTFRVPAKRDEKGWREVERMLAQGVDMVARFSHCWTFEEYERVMGEMREAEEREREEKETVERQRGEGGAEPAASPAAE